MSKPFAWSYSALTRFEDCPKQYYHLNVVKDVKDEKTAQMDEGTLVHDILYKAVVKNAPIPLPHKHLEPIAKQFIAAKGEKHGELKLALTREFEPTEFFAPDVYVRAIIDLLIVRDTHAIIVDYKTGKIKDDFTQLAMSAAVMSQYMPELETFTLAFVWLKHKNVSQKRTTKQELKEVWSELLPRATRIESALQTTSFAAKPSAQCKWCPVRHCPHNKKS